MSDTEALAAAKESLGPDAYVVRIGESVHEVGVNGHALALAGSWERAITIAAIRARELGTATAPA